MFLLTAVPCEGNHPHIPSEQQELAAMSECGLSWPCQVITNERKPFVYERNTREVNFALLLELYLSVHFTYVNS